MMSLSRFRNAAFVWSPNGSGSIKLFPFIDYFYYNMKRRKVNEGELYQIETGILEFCITLSLLRLSFRLDKKSLKCVSISIHICTYGHRIMISKKTHGHIIIEVWNILLFRKGSFRAGAKRRFEHSPSVR